MKTSAKTTMALKIALDREADGRWIAEIPSLPGVLVYGSSRNEAIRLLRSLALRVIADRVESAKSTPKSLTVTFLGAHSVVA